MRLGNAGHDSSPVKSVVDVLALGKLYSFVKVTECGSFTKAAILLDTAHSGLSRQIIELETEIGYRILQRTGRGVRLTEPGKRLYERAKTLLAAASAFEEEARALRGVPMGTVTIGMPGSISSLLGARLLFASSRDFPEVKIRLIEGLSGSMQELLATGRVDFALYFGNPAHRRPSGTPLFESDLHVVGTAHDPRLAAGEVPLAVLAGLRLVLPGMPHSIRHAVEQACAAAGIEPQVPYEADSMTTLKSAVEAGGCFTVTSWDSVAREVAAGQLSAARLVAPILTRELLLEYPQQQPLTIAARAILSLTQSLAHELVKDPAWRLRSPAGT